jgi:hypothetical protein
VGVVGHLEQAASALLTNCQFGWEKTAKLDSKLAASLFEKVDGLLIIEQVWPTKVPVSIIT